MLAVHILKTAGIQHLRLSTEAGNVKAQRLYTDIGFMKLDELDGDDLVFGLSIPMIYREAGEFLFCEFSRYFPGLCTLMMASYSR